MTKFLSAKKKKKMSKLHHIKNSEGYRANCVDPDQAAHDELPHLVLRCLQIQLLVFSFLALHKLKNWARLFKASSA